MTSRLFIAITLSESLKARIGEWEGSADLPVRWTTAENLHVTLLPPWEEANLEEAKLKFKQSLNQSKSSVLTCQDIAYGPEALAPRLIWINCAPSAALRTMKLKLEDVFPSPRENRPYVPHITLARFPRRKWKKLQGHPLNIPFSGEEKVQTIQLIKSELLPDGAHYQVVESVALE